MATKMAADTNLGICLTAEDVMKIVKMEPVSAKDLLSKKLELPLSDMNNQQVMVFTSYMYDNIMFGAEKGLPWDHVCLVVMFAHKYLKRILVESHQLSDALRVFTDLADIIAPLSDRNKKQYTDFVYDTVLCHYNLYKYVFLHPRDSMKPEVTQTVEVPPTPLPLSAGENKVIWEYNNKLKDVEQQEAQALRQQQEIKDRLNKLTSSHKTIDDLNSVPLPYNETVLKRLAIDILSGLAEKKELELKIKVNEVITDLSFKFQKASIPRPSELSTGPNDASKAKSRSMSSQPHLSKVKIANAVREKGKARPSVI